MPSKPDEKATILAGLHSHLESLRSHIIDLEAMAHAAAETIEQIPYLPRLPRHPRTDIKPEWTEEHRRNLGRMQSLTFATAEAAEAVLDEINAVLDRIHQAAQGPEGGDSGPGGTEGGSSASGGKNGDSGPQGTTGRQGGPNGPSNGHARSSIVIDRRPFPTALR